MKKIVNSLWAARVMMFLLGTSLVLSGLRDILSGDLHYSNYWGGVVFAPLALLIGLAILAALAWNWNTLTESKEEPKLRGRAARLARKAEETRFPIDDYKKW